MLLISSDLISRGLIIPIKNYHFCSHGVVDNTMVFGTIEEGSSPSGSTIKPNSKGTSSDFMAR